MSFIDQLLSNKLNDAKQAALYSVTNDEAQGLLSLRLRDSMVQFSSANSN